MADNDVCSRCGHTRGSHHSYAEGGCGSRVRVAKRVKICGCAEFREPVGVPVPVVTPGEDRETGPADVLAGQL